jgi:phosphoesterase RecJ-like protein
MKYSISPNRRPAIQELLEVVSGAQSVILTTHVNADGDGTGSQVAMASWLRAQGKEAWIINPTPFPKSFDFLLPDPAWSVDPGSNRAKEVLEKADLAMVLDTGEVSRIGRVMPLIQGLPLVVVDHHPIGPDPIGGISYRDSTASATGELLFDLFFEAGKGWSPGIAMGLYVAILTDTGSFRFSNASPRAHRVVAELLEKGVNPQECYREVYGAAPLRKLKLLMASLEELEVDPEGLIAWMTIPTEAFESLSATTDDLEGLVDYPREIQGVEVGVLFRETVKGGTKISFRSNGAVDVNALAAQFGGGGHLRAAGAMVERPLATVRDEVLEATRDAVRASAGGGDDA